MRRAAFLWMASTVAACPAPQRGISGPLSGHQCLVVAEGRVDPLLQSTVHNTFEQTAFQLGCQPVTVDGSGVDVIRVEVASVDQGPGEAGMRRHLVTATATAKWLSEARNMELTVPCRTPSLGPPRCHSLLMFQLEPFTREVVDALVASTLGDPTLRGAGAKDASSGF